MDFQFPVTEEEISLVGRISSDGRGTVPSAGGVYAFWWVGERPALLQSSRRVVLAGPGGNRRAVEYEDWWPSELIYPCLYVGKSTNLRKRFALHIKSKSKGRLHPPSIDGHKGTPYTSSCQLRWGIEHLFPYSTDPLSLISSCVGFSFKLIEGDKSVAERFFEECRLVAVLRPWFNIDSER